MGAVPLAHGPLPEELRAAREAADRCACVLVGFAKVLPEQLYSPTRGAPRVAFIRQVWMAGLCLGLGIPAATVGAVVGRSPDTVEHAVRVIEALADGLDLEELEQAELFSDADVAEFFGDPAAMQESLESAAGLIRDAFQAFVFVGVKGPAFCEAAAQRQRERSGK